MSKLFLIALMTLATQTVFAQRYSNCQVVMVDRYHRVIQRYYAQVDYRTGMCREGLRQCNFDLRRRNIYGARCAQIRY